MQPKEGPEGSCDWMRGFICMLERRPVKAAGYQRRCVNTLLAAGFTRRPRLIRPCQHPCLPTKASDPISAIGMSMSPPTRHFPCPGPGPAVGGHPAHRGRAELAGNPASHGSGLPLPPPHPGQGGGGRRRPRATPRPLPAAAGVRGVQAIPGALRRAAAQRPADVVARAPGWVCGRASHEDGEV